MREREWEEGEKSSEVRGKGGDEREGVGGGGEVLRGERGGMG